MFVLFRYFILFMMVYYNDDWISFLSVPRYCVARYKVYLDT